LDLVVERHAATPLQRLHVWKLARAHGIFRFTSLLSNVKQETRSRTVAREVIYKTE
jgi:hypothetical protein